MNYTQLTRGQRYQTYALMKAGHNQSQIAVVVGCHKSTISRELRRNRGQEGYRPDKTSQTTVTRIRKVYPNGVPGNQPVIEIELTSKEVFSNRNSEQSFQIGEFETPGTNPPDGDGYKWIIRMPVQVFENLEDGAPILMKTARGKSGLRGSRRIGRQIKSFLER